MKKNYILYNMLVKVKYRTCDTDNGNNISDKINSNWKQCWAMIMPVRYVYSQKELQANKNGIQMVLKKSQNFILSEISDR